MNSVKKKSSLFETAAFLVKEWHPTANGDLTPRNVKIGYPKKVWWLCIEGFEWEATIKSRLKDNGCPNCADAKKKIDLSISLPAIGKNNRKSGRFKTKATAVIEMLGSGH